MQHINHRFSYFIDNYILLLAERFGIPLSTEAPSERSGGDDVDDIDGSGLAKWEQVAECVREALSRPKTAEERQALLHVDVSMLDAKVCRGRLQYLIWQAERSVEGGVGERIKGKESPSFSVFNITRDSLRDKIQGIYASVRDRLPSTIAPRRNHNGNSTGPAVQSGSQGDKDVMDYDSDGDGSEGSLHVVDVVLPTEAEARRNRVVAEARDDLLSKIQKMQLDFFEKHRRWVDVPFDFDTAPNDGSGPEETSPQSDSTGLSKSAAREALENGTPTRLPPSSEMPEPTMRNELAGESDGRKLDPIMSLFNALREDRRVGRPPRPSQMREEDYEKQYVHASTMPSAPAGFPNALDGQTIRRFNGRPSTESVRTPEPEKPANEPLPIKNTISNGGAVTHEGRAPQLRANRWNVVEYDGEDSSESESSTDVECVT
ncbi:uncharacterized protein TEOVI_000228000 [Trypanosoma equiperdum]|uniref:Uncharacterized protein n=1 Tax=Trypanosoma equiperdum TaxID=5694 RepID=A0A1G4IEI0_TRYEQ|nr:hypothetical protein, conserved [Trypanosoma equiperdum]